MVPVQGVNLKCVTHNDGLMMVRVDMLVRERVINYPPVMGYPHEVCAGPTHITSITMKRQWVAVIKRSRKAFPKDDAGPRLNNWITGRHCVN